ncbi:MAG: DUF3386 family protein [Pirellulales bacterium]
MIVRLRTLWLAALLAALAVPAQAHFVWVSIEQGSNGRPEARVWFGEDPSPGAAHLVPKVAHTKLQSVGGDQASDVELEQVTGDGVGEWVGELPTDGPLAIRAICDYGTYGHGGPLTLVQYYAKALKPATSAELAATARDEKLPLDIVPELTPEGLRFTVYWQGKPAAKTPVSVLDVEGEDEELTTDEQGQALHRNPGKGLISARVGQREADKAGERNGKQYESVSNFTTLTLRLPADAQVAAAPAKAAASTDAAAAPADDLLAKAREARAVWNDFPGFTADVTLSIDGETSEGRLTVDEAGEVVLDLPSSEGLKWARRQLASLVSHRMPGEPIGSGATLQAEAGDHPLGTLLKLKGESMGSVYRVDDNVVTEVNRDTPGGRFTISVMDVYWNQEHKYLPTVFNVSSWEQPSGKLKSSQTNQHRWQRVGAFDLPTSLLEVEAADGGRHVRQLELRNHRLTGEPESTAAAARNVAQ